MQVTSLLSQQGESGPSELQLANRRLAMVIAGFSLVLNSYALQWMGLADPPIISFSALLGAIVLAAPLLRNSFQSLARGDYGINELVSLAIVASIATGDYQTAGVVSFFMLVGELVETRTAAGARASIESLIRLTPTRACKRTGDTLEDVPVSSLREGDVVRVKPGDNIPADGVVLEGQATVNQASITGESLPVEKGPGDEVFAGSHSHTGLLEVRVTRAGEDTTLGRVRELILAAEQTKLPVMRLIDRYIGYYTPLVLVMSGFVWMFTQDLNRVITLLVVSCPCAFVLATPTAMVAAIAAASRLGLLIKNVSHIELAARLNAFVFDKTGTLTTGHLAVCRLRPLPGVPPAELLLTAATAEQFSNHPVAKAVLQLASETGLTPPKPDSFSETAGCGVSATIENQIIRVGRLSWLQQTPLSGPFPSPEDLQEAEGDSLLFVSRANRFLGWIALRDRIRNEAHPTLEELQHLGVRRIAIVTGDRLTVAHQVAREVGTSEILAECMPADKTSYVRNLRQQGYLVAVVGDGVNDAPALAAGDVGIAMGASGSDVAIHSATVALMNTDLRRIPFLITLSRSARRVINQNFLIGTAFILGGLTLAVLGKLDPILGAILHNAGSLLVVFNSARLVRCGENIGQPEPAGPFPNTPAQQSNHFAVRPLGGAAIH